MTGIGPANGVLSFLPCRALCVTLARRAAVLLALATPMSALAQSEPQAENSPQAAAAVPAIAVARRDSFPIGSAEGALCQVQSELRDPSIASMFDRVWTIYCRDAAQPVGKVYALRGEDAASRIGAGPVVTICPVVADQAVAQCGSSNGLPTIRRIVRRGDTVFAGEGIAAYADAVRIALDSVIADRVVPGTIRVATTSVGDANALARLQVASLPADRALAEGYRQNNSGDYAEAAVYFEALERRPPDPATPLDPSEFSLNRALQLSNLGDFAGADRLLAEVDNSPTADPVQLRLRRNFRAMHALNQRDYAGALVFLDQPVPLVSLVERDESGQVRITPVIAAGINNDAGTRLIAQLQSEERLTPQERAIIIDAQAMQLRGTVQRLTGNTAAARTSMLRALAQAAAVRDGRVTSIIRLQAQTLGEIALVDEAEGQVGNAEARLNEAITLLTREYPETMALAAARAKLGAFLVRRDRPDDALRIYGQVVTALQAQRRQLSGLYNQMAPYFRLLVDRQASDPEATNQFFAAVQLLVRPGVADTQAVLARELSGGSGEASTLFRQANNLSRDLERARIDIARLSSQPQSAEVLQLIGEATTRANGLATQQTATLAQLSVFPQYRAVSQDSLTLDQLRGSLGAGESYAKLSVVGDAVYGLLVTQSGTRIWRADVSRDALDVAVDQIRASITVFEGGQYNTYPFDAEAAQALYTQLFGPVASEIQASRHLIFEPDGAMLRLPPNLLITDAASVAAYRARANSAGGDPFDMRGVAWLGRSTRVSTAVSALAFRNTRSAPPSQAARGYLGMGNNLPLSPAISTARTRGSSGSVDAGCLWPAAEWNRPIAPAELFAARTAVGAAGAEVVTGAEFTDTGIIARSDLNGYRILHFATHGLVTAPRPECPARPALLTSFDGAGSAASDGLLSFDEIFDLRLDADLVILSACDTAGQASIAATREAGVTTGGGSALDGLVRAFIGAGGRSVLASHWPAPDSFRATERLVGGLFTARAGTSISNALGAAQDQLMNEAQTSHPFYWAGFAIIGDGARAVLPVPAQAIAATNTDTARSGGL
jgi:CHAT domain-containing protein